MKHALHTLMGMAILLAAMGCKDNKSATTPAGQGSATQKSTVSAKAAATPSETAVKVEFFVMSQCPYGVKVVDAVIPVLKQLGSEVDFHLEFIGNIAGDGSLTAMHGPNEVSGNKAQMCAAALSPENYLDFVACQNKDYRNVATNWNACAKKSKIAEDALAACIEGEQGKALLSDSYRRAQAKGARGSPTMFIGNKPYNLGRETDDFRRAICYAHSNRKDLPACADLPDLKPVNVTLISDKNGDPDCLNNTRNAKNQISSLISQPVFIELDYSDEAAKTLYDKVGGGKLPLLLVDGSIDGDPLAKGALRRGLRPTKDPTYKTITVRATWDPVCGAPGGCELQQCKMSLKCRPEKAGLLELFVMSQCPYGVKALDAMPEVLKNFGSQLDFQVHFIANGTAKEGFKALHGQPEVDENIRELCAIKHYGRDNKFMDYILCRNKNIRSNDWAPCTGNNGIDTAVMKDCFNGEEGKLLHEEDIKIGNMLDVSGSPTWFINGKHKFSALDAETIRKNICQHNPGFKGCENTLSGQTGAPVQGGCQ